MNINPIKTKADHKKALAEIEALWEAESNTPDGDRLDVLATLVEAYERKHYPIDPPDPIEAILFHMEQQGLTRADLQAFIGPSGRVSEVLNRRRPLSIGMVRKLNAGLGIPADVLVQAYPLQQDCA